LREEARLCREEAQASYDTETKRSIATRAFALSQLAEAMARDR